MTLAITHTFVSAIADAAAAQAAGEVLPSHWNAVLTTSMATAKVLGRTTAGTGAIEELSITGSGKVVFDTSPTLVTPALGTPSSGTLTSCTGLPAAGVIAPGSTTQVLFNDGGALAGDADLTWDKTNNSLLIKGDITVDGAPPDVTISGFGVTSGGGGGVLHSLAARGTRASPSAIQTGDFLGGYGCKGYNGTSYQTSSTVAIHLIASENFSPSQCGSYFKILTTPNGTTTRQDSMYVTGTGVGIGSAPLSVPLSALHINGATAQDLRFSNSTNTSAAGDSAGSISWFAKTSAGTDYQSAGIKAVVGLDAASRVGDLIFSTGFAGSLTEAARLTGEKFFGIGRDPTSLLDVYGAGGIITTQANGNTYAGVVIIGGQSGDASWLLASGYPSAGNFSLREAGVQTTLTALKTSGNVGLSVAVPTATLHIRAGTASASSAPLKFTSGTNLTTAEAGAMEYNGTNLFFTRSGTTREGVLTESAVTTEVIVSDTSVTVNIGGTTYKLLARA